MESPQKRSSSKLHTPDAPESPNHPEDSQETQILNPNLINTEPQGTRTQVRTPEPQTRSGSAGPEALFTSPGQIPDFDWDDFRSQYEQALAKANDKELELLREFDGLVRYFNVWAAAASAHDNERAVKRLQTRQRYVQIGEENLAHRKQHLAEVVRAFQSALALLSRQVPSRISNTEIATEFNNDVQDDLEAFHHKHFSETALSHFATQFLSAEDHDGAEEADYDDGLGYYPDGVKRTITDEQIEIFRHSELEAERRKAEKVRNREDGEIDDDQATALTEITSLPSLETDAKTKKKKKKKGGKGKNRRQEVKPDLRKRTWDVVDVGMYNLDYDGEAGSASHEGNPAKRRQVCYEED
ncbi:hypothetical protein MCOR27_003000 [Pyricularia oryzae]|uniref:Uncharacterized protein n=1 Tax=Pyricularia grisea TaxID=148305 RepID=A0ABQ8NHX3_PYRGI|nr:hypothetical protein MCOR27_003000 [Pyricularia oryzae]KAI6297397.1 hypothetical protein MCOR33_006232 [Pyricularia grisea]KAI6294264.1 hypothetical protein MCOR34_009738 [Pyricularia oryzae]KAI6304652.1 hypothetical protein MCOR29_010661 [Pyricularia oryzae]KAI6347751.1 hypothetical protein MCOR28_002106 [Pyricularia oryzae]